MHLLEGLTELLFPTRCAGCEMPGLVLCHSCRANLPLIAMDTACPRCGAPYGRLVCTECWDRAWAFEAALSVGEFEAPLARAVALHKDASERRLGTVLGELLAECVTERWGDWPEVVTFVPATRAAIARRGFDHGRAIARAAAEHLGVPVAEAIGRTAVRDQRALGRVDRARNVAGSFAVHDTVRARVLLCDDVFTTGATLDAAAGALLEAGTSAVRCATVARAW